jgi:ParB family chromosome partitioning protein
MAVEEREVSRETLKGKPGKHRCPHCPYSAMTAGSLSGHIAMAHKDAAPASDAADTVASLEARGMDLEASELAVTIGPSVTPNPGAKRAEAPAGMSIAIASIEVASNVREDLGDLEELTASIREHGILQPIVVTGVSVDGKPSGFRVLEGHRRLAAAAAAGYETVPAILDWRSELGDAGARRSTIQLVENLQRADLNPIEIGHAIAAIVEARKDLTHAQIATWIGKDRSWVTNALRLLETAPEVQAAVLEGKVSATHARAIAAIDVDLQTELLGRVVGSGLSAKDTERAAQRVKDDAKRIRDQAAEIERRTAEAIELLGKVANREKASIAVESYSGIGAQLRKTLTAAGWTTLEPSYGPDRVEVVAQAGACGCTVWMVSVPFEAKSPIALKPACNEPEHKAARREELEAKWARDQARANDERRKEREAAEAAAEQAKGAVAEILAERPLSPLGSRLLVWGLLVADEEFDRGVVGKYLEGGDDDRVVEALFEAEDAAWLITEAIPDEDLDAVQARLVAHMFGGYNAGPGVKAAVDEWSKVAHPESLELAEATPATKGKKLGKQVRLGDLVVIGPDEYLVLSITYPGQEPGADERPPAIVQLGIKGPVKAVDYRLHHVPLADLTADPKAKAWRAPQGALQVVKPSQRVAAPADDAASIAEAREAGGVLECVGSNHVPGCAHMGGEIPAAKPAPAAG